MPMAWHFLFGESDEHGDRIQQIVKKNTILGLTASGQAV